MKKLSLKKYISIIEKLKDISSLTTFDDYHNVPSEKKVIIRHDVDSNLNSSVKFSKIEYKNNIQSTYFLLCSHNKKRNYFIYEKSFVDKCKRILDFGHKIGYHNNILSDYFLFNIPIKNSILKQLDFLRKNNIRIKGTSSHGDKLCYEMGFFNYEIWNEFNLKHNEGYSKLKFPKFSLKDFDLDYETYFTDFNFYISDSGGKWRGIQYNKSEKKLFERSINPSKKNMENTLSKFEKSSHGILQLLTHPELYIIK